MDQEATTITEPNIIKEKSQKELDDEIKKKKEKQGGCVSCFELMKIIFFLTEILGRHWSDHIYGNHHTHCCDSGHHKGCSSLPGGQVLKGCLETFCKVDFQVEDSVSTFIPLEQKKASKIKYTGHGFIPCDGWDKSLEGNLIEVVIHYRIVPCPFSRPGDE